MLWLVSQLILLVVIKGEAKKLWEWCVCVCVCVNGHQYGAPFPV